MNKVFDKHLRNFILVFFDDMLKYSRTFMENLEHLDLVLDNVMHHKLYAK